MIKCKARDAGLFFIDRHIPFQLLDILCYIIFPEMTDYSLEKQKQYCA